MEWIGGVRFRVKTYLRKYAMKIFGVIAFILSFVLTQSVAQEMSGIKVENQGYVSLSLAIPEKDKSKLRLILNLRNDSASPIYIATDPVQFTGKKGYYFSFGENETVLIESRVYAPSDKVRAAKDQTSVRLKRLGPLEEYGFTILLKGGLEETLPPVLPSLELRPHLFKKIELSNILGVQVNIGYFVEDESILQLLRHKEQPVINGLMSPTSGPNRDKCLHEIQEIVSARVEL